MAPSFRCRDVKVFTSASAVNPDYVRHTARDDVRVIVIQSVARSAIAWDDPGQRKRSSKE
jgi:hypothetical protein